MVLQAWTRWQFVFFDGCGTAHRGPRGIVPSRVQVRLLEQTVVNLQINIMYIIFNYCQFLYRVIFIFLCAFCFTKYTLPTYLLRVLQS